MSIALKTTETLTKVFYTSGPNLVILAWMNYKLWCDADKLRVAALMDRQTDTGNNNTHRPKLASGKNIKNM